MTYKGVEHSETVRVGWADLSKSELVALCKIITKGGGSNTVRKYVQIITGLPGRVLAQFTESEMEKVAAESNILIEQPSFRKSHFTRLLLVFKGPGDGLGRMRFKQYGLADQQFRHYWEAAGKDGQNAAALRRSVLAIVYTPAFLPFNARLVTFYSLLFRLVPARIQIAALYNYWAQRNWLREVYDDVFEGGSKGKNYGFRGLIISIAGEKFGTAKSVGRAKLHDVMTYLEMRAEENEEIRRRMKSGK